MVTLGLPTPGSISLLQHQSTSQGNMGDSEPPGSLCESCACVIHTILLSYMCIMHLSMLCPTTPHTGIGGARWGFVTVKVTNPPPLGDDIL